MEEYSRKEIKARIYIKKKFTGSHIRRNIYGEKYTERLIQKNKQKNQYTEKYIEINKCMKKCNDIFERIKMRNQIAKITNG